VRVIGETTEHSSRRKRGMRGNAKVRASRTIVLQDRRRIRVSIRHGDLTVNSSSSY
jgi:hypothetical protein